MPASDQFFRDLKRMHVVFAVSALALLAVTVWMIGVDNAREWHGIQNTQYRIETERLEQDRARIETPQYESTVQDLNRDLKEAQKQLSEKGTQLKEIEANVAKLAREFDLANRKVREQRQYRDVARANYDLAVRDGIDAKILEQKLQTFNKQQAGVDRDELELQKKDLAYKEGQAKLAREMATVDELNAKIKKLKTSETQVEKALFKVDPDKTIQSDTSTYDAFKARFADVKRTVMEWPIINGFNSPLRIQQDWLPNLDIQLGMAKSARFDRCRTCHGVIDRVEAGNVPAYPLGHPMSKTVGHWVKENAFPHPYATHPNPDLYLASSSPHPVSKFGCTICHDGQGSGTSFSTASHTPNNPHEAEEWERIHQFAANHFWEYPMNPKRFEESSCLKCHHSVVELGVNHKFGASAPNVFRGYDLIRTFGCFGCHEINGYNAGRSIGPDIRLEPTSPEEAARLAADPTQVPGEMRKVGPSLRHIASKTTRAWTEFWTEEPKRFRPTTRMPQFFNLSNQQDAHAQEFEPIELAGIANYLFSKSQPIELLSPQEGYRPDAARGKTLFSMRGCLACHSHRDFPDTKANFGPELSRVAAKIKPGREGSLWLYTWVRDPQRHHPRTKMPNLFLEPYVEGGATIDPAADITAFLLQRNPNDQSLGFNHDNPLSFVATGNETREEARSIADRQKALDALVKQFLAKSLADEGLVLQTMQTRSYPIPREKITGDEIELAPPPGTGPIDDEQWQQMKLNYVGRRTISQFGCFGCHDIAGFENARPIGTALQDWGRKDTSRLAFEHIDEFLAHHGEPDGSSTAARVAAAMKSARAGGAAAGEFGGSHAREERELSAAFFYENLVHHGRPGFIWQKLREPRSYDFEKTETKAYDERLRMPKFPFDEEQIEAISTFVLGLVADPPPSQYLYQPQGAARARIDGERLIETFNCTGCHMLEMPEIRYGVDLNDLVASELTVNDHPQSLAALMKLKPPQNAETGQKMTVGTGADKKTLPVIRFHGLLAGRPDPQEPPEAQEFTYDTWETIEAGKKQIFPGSRMVVLKSNLAGAGAHSPDGYARPARGGEFAEWLVEMLTKTTTGGSRGLAWQMAPPPLYKEGVKVQSPWLYRFLRDPGRLRHTTVLRMPRFNMSSEQAQTLANYFAAVDNAVYPYQEIREREPGYLAMKDEQLRPVLGPKDDYLAESWKMLNGPVCIKCHSVGGREVKIGDPKVDIRGPNLEQATDRLRPEWLTLWLYNPKWITPYTSMPQPFLRGQKLSDLFGGDGQLQTEAVRDALLNYNRLIEREGKFVADEPAVTQPAGERR